MNYMYLNEYEKYPKAKVDTSILWEYDLSKFDYQDMRNLVVQRVIERGWPDDWYAILNMYGEDGVKTAIREIPYLNDKDMNFVSKAFEIPLSEMKCYIRKQLHQAHWNA
ncbi:MAG: DUF6922 domain-containing protein [Chitinophagaceae bacterium]